MERKQLDSLLRTVVIASIFITLIVLGLTELGNSITELTNSLRIR